MGIHATAVVEPSADIHPSADIGPFVTVEGSTRIAAGTRIHPYVLVREFTEIAAGCTIHSHACLGDVPQDRGYKDERSYCRIGSKTVIREGVTIHRASHAEAATTVGEDCFLMANAHVGHDCQLGDRVIVANGALLAGHVTVGLGAFISGNTAVHQFVRIGELAMIGGLAKIVMDVPPYFLVSGRGICVGVNVVGLRRAGFSKAERDELGAAYRLLYRSGVPFRDAVDQLASTALSPAAIKLVGFLRQPSRRGFISARAGSGMRLDQGIASRT